MTAYDRQSSREVRGSRGLMGQRCSSRANPPYELRQNGLRHKPIAQAVYCEKV
jgi:hypothetical protein